MKKTVELSIEVRELVILNSVEKIIELLAFIIGARFNVYEVFDTISRKIID